MRLFSSRFDFPLPMILDSYADGDLSFTLGLPVVSVRWQLDPATTLAASYAPVRQARLALGRQLSPTLKATLEGPIEEESYFIAGRRNEECCKSSESG